MTRQRTIEEGRLQQLLRRLWPLVVEWRAKALALDFAEEETGVPWGPPETDDNAGAWYEAAKEALATDGFAPWMWEGDDGDKD